MTTDAETYHRKCIEEITRHARAAAQPHIDALVRIEALKPPKPFVAFIDEKGHIIPQDISQ